MRLALYSVLILCLTLAAPAGAAEIATLDNGRQIRALSVERDGDRVALLMPEGGRIEIATSRLASIEHVQDPPPVVATPTPAAPPVEEKSVRELVTDAALRYGLPPELVHGVAQAESAYRASAVSPKGAIGVMQLMPQTAHKLDADPTVPVQNIDAGTRLLRDLLLRYQGADNGVRRALAAYNAGEGAVERYGGVPPYPETQGYVEKVIGLYWKNVRESSAKPSFAAPSGGEVASAAAVESSAGSK